MAQKRIKLASNLVTSAGIVEAGSYAVVDETFLAEHPHIEDRAAPTSDEAVEKAIALLREAGVEKTRAMLVKLGLIEDPVFAEPPSTATPPEPPSTGDPNDNANVPPPADPDAALLEDLEKMMKDELADLAEKEKLTVTGTGANGAVLKDDLVRAIFAHAKAEAGK